ILVRRPVFPIFGHKRVFLRFDCIKRSGDSKPVVQPVFDRKSGRDTFLFRDDNKNRTHGYPSEMNPNLMWKTRCNWILVLPKFNFQVRVWYS
ncbi:hypothetical protein Lal_00042701, partial [Lupinus albus]